jgi:hypothetical protein
MTSPDGDRRGIDFEEMEATLKRAACKAMQGTRQERSGPLLSEEKSRGLLPDRQSKNLPNSSS